MPSLRHSLVSRLIGVVRPNPPLDDLDAVRSDLVEQNRQAHEGPSRRVRRGRAERIDHQHGFPVVSLWRPGPSGEAPDRAFFYLHGGAYVRPSDRRHWRFATRIADRIGARAVLPLYPLAPGSTVDDSFSAMADLFEEVAAECPGGVVLAGDSAGGGYALALALELRDRARAGEGAQPEALVLVAPWVDLTGTTPGTREAAERDPWLSYPHLSVYASFWAGTDDPDVLAGPRLSPLHGDLSDLPRAQMFCGTRDLLQPACDALFDRADEADWELEYVVAPGLLHVYPILPVPEARAAVDAIVEFALRA